MPFLKIIPWFLTSFKITTVLNFLINSLGILTTQLSDMSHQLINAISTQNSLQNKLAVPQKLFSKRWAKHFSLTFAEET